MSRAFCFGMLLFVGPFLSPSWAQNKTEPTDTGPRYPRALPFEWDYSCPGAGRDCSFVCTGERAVHVIKLRINLETITLEGSQKAPSCVLRFLHDRDPAGEWLCHKRRAQHLSMSSQWHEVGLFWSTEIASVSGPINLRFEDAAW